MIKLIVMLVVLVLLLMLIYADADANANAVEIFLFFLKNALIDNPEKEREEKRKHEINSSR